jgi:hypothetical protein
VCEFTHLDASFWYLSLVRTIIGSGDSGVTCMSQSFRRLCHFRKILILEKIDNFSCKFSTIFLVVVPNCPMLFFYHFIACGFSRRGLTTRMCFKNQKIVKSNHLFCAIARKFVLLLSTWLFIRTIHSQRHVVFPCGIYTTLSQRHRYLFDDVSDCFSHPKFNVGTCVSVWWTGGGGVIK